MRGAAAENDRRNKNKTENWKMEAAEEIQNLKQKLSIQKEKCNTLEVQQNVLMDILDIPQEERNFLSLREGLENLKNDYVNEKERADNLACQMPIPQSQDSSTPAGAKISEQEPEMIFSNPKVSNSTTKPAIHRRLARRGGVKCNSGLHSGSEN